MLRLLASLLKGPTMNTAATDSKTSEHPKPHASPAPNPLRLVILLSVLVVFGGALVYDWAIAPPRVRAAYDKLQDTALKHNEFGIKPAQKKDVKSEEANSAESRTGGMLYSDDIHQILGMTPTKVEKTDLYTIEHYCWWGWIPRNGNFITVLYIGNPDKPHYSTHYANSMPDDEAIPGRVKNEPAKEDTSGAGTAASAAPAAGMPGMGGPAMGGPGMGPPPMPGVGGGKGKGRPQGKGEKKKDNTKETEADAKKSDEGTKTDEPKKSEAGEKK